MNTIEIRISQWMQYIHISLSLISPSKWRLNVCVGITWNPLRVTQKKKNWLIKKKKKQTLKDAFRRLLDLKYYIARIVQFDALSKRHRVAYNCETILSSRRESLQRFPLSSEWLWLTFGRAYKYDESNINQARAFLQDIPCDLIEMMYVRLCIPCESK